QSGATRVQRLVRSHARDYAGAEASDRSHFLDAICIVDVRIFEEPKIDCHVHVLDPARFPYGATTHYRPMGQEMGTPAQLVQAMEAYGTRHALLVGPNSGYGLDNSCMLDTIAYAPDRYRGIAVVENDISVEALRSLKSNGVVGVAWNVTHYGLDYYRNARP